MPPSSYGGYSSQPWSQQRAHPQYREASTSYDDEETEYEDYDDEDAAPRGTGPARGGGGGGAVWLCSAEGQIGTSSDDGSSWDYSTDRALGTGPSRAAAAAKAIEDCNSLLTMSSTLAMNRGDKRDVGTCSVTECTPPGR